LLFNVERRYTPHFKHHDGGWCCRGGNSSTHTGLVVVQEIAWRAVADVTSELGSPRADKATLGVRYRRGRLESYVRKEMRGGGHMKGKDGSLRGGRNEGAEISAGLK